MSEKIYSIQLGTLTRLSDAEEQMNELIDKGLDCKIVEINGSYRCQVGAFSMESSAKNFLDDIKIAGYRNAFIIGYER